MKRKILLTSLLSILFVASSFAERTFTESGSYAGSTIPWGIKFDADDITVTLVDSDDTTGWAIRTTENVKTKATLNISYGLTYYELNNGLFYNPAQFKGTGEFIITGTGTYDAVTGDATHNMANTILDVRGYEEGTSTRTGNGLMAITFSVANTKFGNLTIASNNTVKIANGNVSMTGLTVNSGAIFTSETDTLALNGAIKVDSANVSISNMTTSFKSLTVSGDSRVEMSVQNVGTGDWDTAGYAPPSITTSGTSVVTVNSAELDGNTRGPTVEVNDTSTLNLNVAQDLTWGTSVTVANGGTFNLTNTHNKSIIDLNLADGATATLNTTNTNTNTNSFCYVGRNGNSTWGTGGSDKTTVSFNRLVVLGAGTNNYTLTVGSNTEIKLADSLVIAHGKLVLNSSNNIKNLNDETQAQGDFLALKFSAEKRGTLSLGADNAVKSIGFTSLEGNTITPGTGLIELNGYEFTFNEFIEDANGKISFVDFDEYLVKFTGDKNSLTTNDDGSLMYIFAGADADQKLYLGADGYLSLTATAVPEPAEWAMIFGAVALGFAIYRKRKNA